MIRSLRAPAAALLAATALAALAGCASVSTGAGSAPSTAAPTVTGDVVVFAAASLTDTFGDIATAFEAKYPGTKVVPSFGGSSALAEQITQGAPADVFAAASSATMKTVTDAGDLDGDPVDFATNALEIAVPPGNPGKVTGLPDFGDEKLKIALCATEVPCGAAAKIALDAAGVTAKPDTLEQDVTAVLTKVKLGEVDAGLVYSTDVLSAGDAVTGIDCDCDPASINTYPIGVVAKAPNPEGAAAFMAFVTSPEGRSILTKAGFGDG